MRLSNQGVNDIGAVRLALLLAGLPTRAQPAARPTSTDYGRAASAALLTRQRNRAQRRRALEVVK